MTKNDIRDAAWFEREYNPRLTVPETADLLAAWQRDGAATRARRPYLANIPTGSHARECADLFRAANPKGLLVFLHGGYWRSFSKDESSWIANGFVDQGTSVAILNYPLCPEVTLGALIQSVRRSFAKLYTEVFSRAEREKVVVAGHSAGGYLAIAFVATDWESYGLPPEPFQAALSISGIFELAPLISTSMNQAIRLDAVSAAALTLTAAVPRMRIPLLFAVGQKESAEFHRQSEAMAAAWPQLDSRHADIPDANHFSVVNAFAEPGSTLNHMALALFA